MKKLFVLLACCIWLNGMGQVAINTDGGDPDGSAMLDVQSTTMGILVPRLTLAERNAIVAPATGLIIFQSDNAPGFYYYNGLGWKAIGSEVISIDGLTDGKTTGMSVYLGDGTGLNDDGSNNQNVALGDSAFHNSTTGFWNTAVGYQALYSNVQAPKNIAIGYRSLFSNTFGNNNTALGTQSLFSNTTAHYNLAVGYKALYENTTGANNTALGYAALQSNMTGTGNVAVGYLAGSSETGSNKLYIENSGSSIPLIYGEFDNDLLRINGTLDINNEYIFPTTDGTSGQVLRTNGNDTLSWFSDDDANPGNELNTSIQLINDTLKISDAGGTMETSLGSLVDDSDWMVSGNNMYSNVTGMVGIGTSSPDAKLHVAGSIKITDGNQAEGKLLTSDANGNSQWQHLGPQSVFGSELPEPDFSCLSVSGSLAIGSNSRSVAVSGNYAYVVDWTSDDLKVIDVSNPASPTLSGSLAIGDYPFSVAVSGNYAYVVDIVSEDLKVIDVSNPSNPTLSGSLAIGSNPRSVAVSGNYACVVDSGSDDLKVIDVSNPSSPTLSGSLAIGSDPRSVAVSGNYAYVVDIGSDDLKVIDVSNPSSPTLSGSLAIGDYPESVAVSGNYAYVVDSGSNDLKVIDVSNPSSPTLNGSLAIGYDPRSVAVSGNYAYVVDVTNDDLKVIDVSNPSSPTLSGSLAIGDYPFSVAVSGNYACVVDLTSDDLKVIQLSCFNGLMFNPIDGNFLEGSFNWKNTGNDIYSANAGNVGIGISDPVCRLHLETSSTGLAYPLKIENRKSSYVSTGILFSTGGPTNERGKGALVYEYNGLGWNRGDFHFLQNTEGNISNPDLNDKVMTIENDGDIKIFGTLDINNAYRFPTIAGADGQILQSDGSGNLSWSTDVGADEINGLSDGKTGGGSVFLGDGAGSHDDGSDNQNSAIGDSALFNNASGSFNTATGYGALYSNTTGWDNSAIGHNALYLNTTGNCNTAIGSDASCLNVTGDSNVAIGYEAGYYETGSNKLYIENSNSTTPLIYGEFDNDLLRINGTLDINNEYIFPTTDGTNGQVLKTNGSGILSWIDESGTISNVGSMASGAVFAGPSADNQWLGLGSTAGRIEFEDETTDEVNILDAFMGLGISDPVCRLHLEKSSTGLAYPLKIENRESTTSGATGIMFSAGGPSNERGKGALVYEYNGLGWNRGDFHFLQNTDANSGNPDLSDKVMSIENDGDIKIYALGTGTVYSNSGILTNINPSDKRLKSTINAFSGSLDKVMKLRPVTFNWISTGLPGIGFIAQEVEKVIPELVAANLEGMKGIYTTEMIPYMVKAMQEQQGMIENQHALIEMLQEQNSTLVERIEKLEGVTRSQ